MLLIFSCPYWPFLVSLIIPIILFAITATIIEIVGAWFRFILIPILGFGKAVYSGDNSKFEA
jgi:hypothetical protein